MRRTGIVPRRLRRLASIALLGLVAAGDPDQGLAVVTRQSSTCVLCHAGPWANPHLQGNIGPDLHGVGARLTSGQISSDRFASSRPRRRIASGFQVRISAK